MVLLSSINGFLRSSVTAIATLASNSYFLLSLALKVLLPFSIILASFFATAQLLGFDIISFKNVVIFTLAFFVISIFVVFWDEITGFLKDDNPENIPVDCNETFSQDSPIAPSSKSNDEELFGLHLISKIEMDIKEGKAFDDEFASW